MVVGSMLQMVAELASGVAWGYSPTPGRLNMNLKMCASGPD